MNMRVKKICKTAKKGFDKINDPCWRAKSKYIKYYDSLQIDERSILIESQHGTQMNGNVFYLIRYLSNDVKYKDYKVYLCARADKVKTFKNMLAFYKLNNVKITILSSDEYFKILASAKYLINDNTFLPFFIKREGQVYLNTWHGTPLKSLGKRIKDDAHAIGNAQKNFVCADYLLFPNEHTRDAIIQDYMIENISCGSYLMAGYPRNEVFFNNEERRRYIRGELKLNEKKVYAYMPTFRGTARAGKTLKNSIYLNYYLYELDEKLRDDEILFLNLHPVASKDVEFEQFKHIKSFPADYETYDFLSATDALVTDYSSVFFDYALLQRKIILFTYDKLEYFTDRGMYLSLDDLPFPQVASVEDLLYELRSEKKYNDHDFLEKYCKYENQFASQKLCDYVILGERTEIEEHRIPNNGKENVLLYAGNLAGNGITTSLRSLLSVIDLDKRNYYFAFYSERLGKNQKAIFTFPEKACYFAMTGDMNLTIQERMVRKLFKIKRIKADKYMDLMGQRVKQDLKRCFGGAMFDHMIQFNGYEQEVILGFSVFDGDKAIFVHNDMLHEIDVKGNQRYDVLQYAYQHYDKVAIVTDDMRKSTMQFSGKEDNIQVVNNIIDYKSILKKAEAKIQFDSFTQSSIEEQEVIRILESSETEVFINIGRFAPEKGHEQLIDAFSRYYRDHANAYLIIMGGYSLDNRYDKLKQMIEDMHLEKNVVLIESVSNPYPILKKCDYLVLSSHYEGFGLVLAEADVLGIPVISTNIPGPYSFMKKYGGTLVEDSPEGVYQGMCMLHEGKVSPMNVDYEKYNQEAIEEFEQLLG